MTLCEVAMYSFFHLVSIILSRLQGDHCCDADHHGHPFSTLSIIVKVTIIAIMIIISRALVFTTMLLLVRVTDQSIIRMPALTIVIIGLTTLVRATIIARVTIVITKIISESGNHRQSDNHRQSHNSHHQDHQSGDLAISGWMSLKLLVTTLLAIVKKPGASTD